MKKTLKRQRLRRNSKGEMKIAKRQMQIKEGDQKGETSRERQIFKRILGLEVRRNHQLNGVCIRRMSREKNYERDKNRAK